MVDNRIDVRLDETTFAQFTAYAELHQMTSSQACRMLLALALRDEQSADVAWRKAAFREGVTLGVRAIRKNLTTAVSTAVKAAFGDMDAHE